MGAQSIGARFPLKMRIDGAPLQPPPESREFRGVKLAPKVKYTQRVTKLWMRPSICFTQKPHLGNAKKITGQALRGRVIVA